MVNNYFKNEDRNTFENLAILTYKLTPFSQKGINSVIVSINLELENFVNL